MSDPPPITSIHLARSIIAARHLLEAALDMLVRLQRQEEDVLQADENMYKGYASGFSLFTLGWSLSAVSVQYSFLRGLPFGKDHHACPCI
jgi:hypothetical protein